MSLCVHACVVHVCPWMFLNMSACVNTFLPSCVQSGIWRVSLHPWWASLSQMDGLSQCQRGDSWLAWPLLAMALDPVLWQLLTAPDGWHVYSFPTHELASWKLLVCREINDASQHVLMKCKLYEPHPVEMTPELISALKEAATLLMIE